MYIYTHICIYTELVFEDRVEKDTISFLLPKNTNEYYSYLLSVPPFLLPLYFYTKNGKLLKLQT